GSELPIESASASVPPSGGELPDESTSPTGGVEGVVGTPPANGATPPPTDTLAAPNAASDQSWRAVLIGLAALIAAAVFMVPTPRRTPARNSTRIQDRGR
ncbi:MAG: hypothetical protein QOF49_35, partial [Chloroflexota bacterium]|nr:hypothetical protein [Chloroflexota bacterium]